jgi:c-di-GMP-related signal transduction protein
MPTLGWLKRDRTESGVFSQVTLTTPIPAAAPSPNQWRYIARQAIFDGSRNVFGYELLARSGWENRFSGDPDAATQKMISDGVLYGLEGLTRGKRAFINCTRESLVEGLVSLLPKNTVLEVLETIAPDDEVVRACRYLKAQGYPIALDDFSVTPGAEALVELADFIKVDFRLSDREERREILRSLQGTRARLVAEKVETLEEYKTASDEGFELFPGFYFCHPQMFTAKRPPATGHNYFRLLSALSQSHLNFAEIASLVKSEVTICYQLLRLVNSVGFGLREPVRSIHSALTLVGESQFRKLVINAIALETCSRHPDELLIRVLQRARFMELMSPYTGEDPEEQYLLGLLSMMGVVLESPVDAVIETLPLRAEVKDALKGKPSRLTTALRLLECYERGNWELCLEKSAALKISEGKLAQIYTETLAWAEKTAMPTPAGRA